DYYSPPLRLERAMEVKEILCLSISGRQFVFVFFLRPTGVARPAAGVTHELPFYIMYRYDDPSAHDSPAGEVADAEVFAHLPRRAAAHQVRVVRIHSLQRPR